MILTPCAYLLGWVPLDPAVCVFSREAVYVSEAGSWGTSEEVALFLSPCSRGRACHTCLLLPVLHWGRVGGPRDGLGKTGQKTGTGMGANPAQHHHLPWGWGQ